MAASSNDPPKKIKKAAWFEGKLHYIDSEGKTQILGKKEDETSGHILNLIDYLDSAPSNTDVIISIGTGEGGPNSWQQNINFSNSRNTLIINIDPAFENTKIYPDTANKKYLPIFYNKQIAEIIDPLVSKLLDDKQNNVCICDCRSPGSYRDCYSILNKNIEHYRDPDSSTGNLIMLQGYFSFCPSFWPTKKTIEEEYKKIVNEGNSCRGFYAEIFSGMHQSPQRLESLTKSYEIFFKDKSVLTYERGCCFLYDKFGSVDAIQQEIKSSLMLDSKQENAKRETRQKGS